jgi:uncharacterized protein YkwD
MSIGSPAGAGHRKSSLLTVLTAASVLCVALGTHGADKPKPQVRKSPAAAAKPQKAVAEEKAEPAAEEKPKTVGVVGIAVTFVAKGVVPPKKVDAAAVAGAKAAAEVKADEAATEEEEPKEETKKPKKKKSTKAAAKANAVAKSKAGGFGGFGGTKSNSFGGGSFGSGMSGSGAGGFASAGSGAFSGMGGLPYAAGGLMNFSPVMSIASANATAVAVASGDGAQASASASAGAFAAGGTLATTDDAKNCPKDTPTDSGEETTDDDAGLGNLPEELASVIKLTNQARTTAGLGTLTANDTLMTLAQEQSDRMANANTMSHEVNGLTFMQRITSSTYNPAYAGENIAFGQTTPEEVVTAWMNSPGHRANILNPNFTEIGVGVAQGSNGALYWTQIFGTPMGGSTQSGSQTNSGTTDTTGTTESTDSGTTTSNAAQSTGKQASGN